MLKPTMCQGVAPAACVIFLLGPGISGDRIINDRTYAQVINNDIILDANQDWMLEIGTGALTIDGDVQIARGTLNLDPMPASAVIFGGIQSAMSRPAEKRP